MPFTPCIDHTPRFADWLAGQNPVARTTPVAPFWPPGLPEDRMGLRGYPTLLAPRQAGTPAGWKNGLDHRSVRMYKNSQFGLTDASSELTWERLNRVGLDGVS